MAELYFLRHGRRIDSKSNDDDDKPIYADYKSYDPSLAQSAVNQIQNAADSIVNTTQVFKDIKNKQLRKNIFIHFSPYLRCCQTADILLDELKIRLSKTYPQYKLKFQLLGDFALSEWIHEKMNNKPPFFDSNDAYQMYIPNIKILKNKSCCSNFRPTNMLGHFNGPNLSYKDYQANCKSYFTKLIATYDKPVYVKNEDIIIVVSHGYVINNFMSYFLNHPIFEEIPEASINYAVRETENEATDSDEINLEDYHWVLKQDALGITQREDIDATLNLETDIVYYKTNFFKKGELDTTANLGMNAAPDELPRSSFRLTFNSDSSGDSTHQERIRNLNPICSAAKDWTPQKAKQFKIASEFKLKAINDDAFKKVFNIRNHPHKPVTPEVSPNSSPTRNNSVIDLTRIHENSDINKPMKLKYSSASEIPIHRLNSKLNSHSNLAQLQRGGSNDSSTVDLSKYISLLTSKNRNRSTSNPQVVTRNTKDSYFPSLIFKKDRGFFSSGSNSSLASDISMEEGEESRSHEANSIDSLGGSMLKLNSSGNEPTSENPLSGSSSNTNNASKGGSFGTQSRKYERNSSPFLSFGSTSPKRKNDETKIKKSIFYNFGERNSSDSDQSSSEDESQDGNNDNSNQSKYIWFGERDT